MGKKILTLLLLLSVGVFVLPTIAYADIGPKPSVNINFVGMEDTVYYITLLSQTESAGPHSFRQTPIDETSSLVDVHKQEDLGAWNALRGYRDADGFYFLNYFQRSNQENTYEWGYYPPSTFKVLLYFPGENRFIVSDIQEKYAFDSYYQVSLTEGFSVMTVEKNYNYSLELLSFFARMLFTLAIELFIALLFGLRKKSIFLCVLTVNTITQLILNVLLNIINYKSGGIAFISYYLLLELLIIFIESAVFMAYFNDADGNNELEKWVAPVYAFVANSASFVIGITVSAKLPEIF